MGSRILSLKKTWVGYHYHSTHSSFARGVSVLVLKTLPFWLLDLALDPDGRFVMIHATIYSLTWTIVGLYLPPPASLSLLKQITSKMAEFASDNSMILGDFNLVPDLAMDRLTFVGHPCSGLAEWANTYGLTDVWRWRHPHTRAYTCYSASHRTFSRIDLVYVGGPVLPRVTDVRILPRGISDHAPLLMTLDPSVGSSTRLWRLSRFWISDITVDNQFHTELTGYWATNAGTADATTVWDTFKATMRGQYQTIIARVRRKRKADLMKAERDAASGEELFIRTRDSQQYAHLQLLTREVLNSGIRIKWDRVSSVPTMLHSTEGRGTNAA